MFRKPIINLAFKLIDSFLINRITYPPVRIYLERSIAPLKQVANIFTDKNPENEGQLKELWADQRDSILDTQMDLAEEIIADKIKNQETKSAFLEILAALRSELEIPDGDQ